MTAVALSTKLKTNRENGMRKYSRAKITSTKITILFRILFITQKNVTKNVQVRFISARVLPEDQQYSTK